MNYFFLRLVDILNAILELNRYNYNNILMGEGGGRGNVKGLQVLLNKEADRILMHSSP